MNNQQYGLPQRDLEEHQNNDDEPDQNIEHIMDDSSGSGSDGEETEEDKRNYREALKRADSML